MLSPSVASLLGATCRRPVKRVLRHREFSLSLSLSFFCPYGSTFGSTSFPAKTGPNRPRKPGAGIGSTTEQPEGGWHVVSGERIGEGCPEHPLMLC